VLLAGPEIDELQAVWVFASSSAWYTLMLAVPGL
jgi:hypothetical protein